MVCRFNGREGLKLLHRSGPHILQSLCSNLGCRKVYMEISALVNDGTWSGRFGPMVIQALSVLLVTSMSSLQLQVQLDESLMDRDPKIFTKRCITSCFIAPFFALDYVQGWKQEKN